jgi:outer membrane protein TolC
MRWMKKVTSFTLMLTTIAGCARQVYLPESVAQNMQVEGHLPSEQELRPAYITNPLDLAHISPDLIATTDHPDLPIKYLSLNEAIANAVEHGTEGVPDFVTGTNTTDVLTLLQFQGPGTSSTQSDDSVRAFSFDPAIVGASIESAESRFDARLLSSMNWTTTDRPLASASDLLSAAGTTTAIRDQAAAFSSSLLKPLASGGIAGITFSTNYDLSNLPTPTKPVYTPLMQFTFEQPLLKGFGTEINQISPQFPSSILTPNLNTTVNNALEGIVITRLRFDQQRAEFERHLHNVLVSVETAYWNLYGQYWNLYSQEAALTQAWVAWKITKAKTVAGQQTEADLKQAQSQYETFRSSRLAALSGVLEKERVLRNLMGLPFADGCRIVPSDSPTLAEFRPDFCSAEEQALALRPELIIGREDLKWRQLNLISARNQFLPDLRLTSSYGINGIGSTLTGTADDSAFKSLASDHFDNWSMGLVFNMPLGRRDAEAGIRIARLNIARVVAALEDQEYKARSYVLQQYRNVIDSYKQISINRSNREALSAQVLARYQQYNAGKTTLDILLEAQRNWSAAIQSEYAAIVAYNNALVLFEYARGTIMQHNNVSIAEGPLPGGVAKRAAEHERERNAGLVLLERNNPVPHPMVGGDCVQPALPDLPNDSAASLPSLFEKSPKMGKDLPDKLTDGKPNSDVVNYSPNAAPTTTAPLLPANRPTQLPLIKAVPSGDQGGFAVPSSPAPVPSSSPPAQPIQLPMPN